MHFRNLSKAQSFLAVTWVTALATCFNNVGENEPGGSGNHGSGGATSAGGSATFGGAGGGGGGTIGSGGTTGTGEKTSLGGASGRGGTTNSGGSTGSGGSSATGGAKGTGGTGTGGATGSGANATTGGANGTGGPSATGGAASTGGAKGTGGLTATGGVGGAGGAKGTGGATGTGASSSAFSASYFLGADVTDQEVAPDATRVNLLSIMKSHGFNSVRLRTFVDPKAADGYDKTNGYDDITHTVAFGKQVKDAGMGLLIDFHYSDNWADPGKQCVPIAWQRYTTIADLATAVHDYTKDAIAKLTAGGARPDMVQIGNETTPGMLLHRCDSGGQPTGNNPITGSTSNWANLGALLKAGVQGVKDVDPGIRIAFHIDRCGDKPTDTQGAALQTSITWLTNAMKYVTPDAFGESCYQRYQGDPNSTTVTKTGWTNTFGGLAAKFPNIKFFAAEYGPMQREVNDVVYGLAGSQGIGTFTWEPTTQGDWNTGHDLFRRSGSTYTAQPDLALYDRMKIDYASRL
jgi:arabinogalactan endo-1,4-beta-galactosidase